ncbi:MAG: chromosomal replication initiator protein DnaA [Clostridia bacterium]|nr:chromosomal replication initiator protein DnaA [Clostridia bacterium]
MNSELNKMWQECLSILENEVSSVSFNTWIKDIVPISADGLTITLSVESSIKKNMVEKLYGDLLKNTILEITGKGYDINIIVAQEIFKEEKKPEPKSYYSKYTFDNFVVGNSNRFAQSAALAVAEAPSYAYNPLFLYGGVGLGKTHLMHAIGNYILQNNPEAKILFLSAEKFTTELIEALRDNKTQEFRNKYRNIDVLLVDDIQFIAGKSATEEEFFHTFNTLHEANKQIVLTSDRPPREIKTLEERLRSRFEWGLICDIQPPDFETRMAILSKKAKDENISISDEIIEYIAQNVKSNIRELEGVFNRVVAYRGLIKKEITLDLVIETLKDYGETSSRSLTPEYIIEYCANFYNVKKEDIYSEKRNKEIVFARQVCLYIIRELTDYSLTKIGLIFGKDHATVLYAIKKLTNIMESDLSIKISIESLMKDISDQK